MGNEKISVERRNTMALKLEILLSSVKQKLETTCQSFFGMTCRRSSCYHLLMSTPTGTESAASEAGGSLSRAGDLFQLLRDGKARTRAELALTTGLARSTVASRIDALMVSGLVGPAGEASSSGGRPPSRFAFNPAARVVLDAARRG